MTAVTNNALEGGNLHMSVLETDLLASVIHSPEQFNGVTDVTPEMISDPYIRVLWAYAYEKKGKVSGSVLAADAMKRHELGRALANLGGGAQEGPGDYEAAIAEGIDFIMARGPFAGPAESFVEPIRDHAIGMRIEQVQRQLRPENFASRSEYLMALNLRLGQVASSMSAGAKLHSLADGAQEALDSFLWRTDHPGEINGVKLGLFDYDMAVGGYQPGELIMIGGHSGEGKTHLKAFAALRSVLTPRDDTKQPAKAVFFSLEMLASEMAARWLSSLSGVNIRERNPTRDQVALVKKAHTRIQELSKSRRLIVHDAGVTTNLEQIVRLLHKAKNDDDIDVAFIDYAQLITTHGGGDASKYDLMAKVSQKLKQTVSQLGIAAVVGVQLNREALTGGNAGRPQMRHVADSMDLVRSADMLQMIWTPARHLPANRLGPWGGKAAILTEKVRARPYIAPLYYDFDPGTTRFHELHPDVLDILRNEESQALLVDPKAKWDPKKS